MLRPNYIVLGRSFQNFLGGIIMKNEPFQSNDIEGIVKKGKKEKYYSKYSHLNYYSTICRSTIYSY